MEGVEVPSLLVWRDDLQVQFQAKAFNAEIRFDSVGVVWFVAVSCLCALLVFYVFCFWLIDG
jgi:hypothetical protein